MADYQSYKASFVRSRGVFSDGFLDRHRIVLVAYDNIPMYSYMDVFSI